MSILNKLWNLVRGARELPMRPVTQVDLTPAIGFVEEGEVIFLSYEDVAFLHELRKREKRDWIHAF